MRIRITGGDEQKWYHNLFGYKFDVANIDLDGDYMVDPGDFRPEVGPIAWVSPCYAEIVEAEQAPVPQSVDYFNDRELRLIKNCVNHVNDDPAGLPGHNLMVIIAKFAKLNDHLAQRKPITTKNILEKLPEMSSLELIHISNSAAGELYNRAANVTEEEQSMFDLLGE